VEHEIFDAERFDLLRQLRKLLQRCGTDSKRTLGFFRKRREFFEILFGRATEQRAPLRTDVERRLERLWV
jgi:hypothetical protein